MIVKLGRDGILVLDQIFTKKTLEKIASYSMDKSDTAIRIQFYDKAGKEFPIKLRKRGQSKKTT